MEWTKEIMDKVCQNTHIKFKDEKTQADYEKCVVINSNDNYGFGIVKFMDRWAKCMQYLIEEKGYNVAAAARETEFVCDLEGMSGFSFGCALNTLCKTWKYGEDLRKWHNGEYNYEGEGVVNPAVINITEN